jgi:hypothetical protein
VDVPAATAETFPVLFIVAIPVAVLLHVPPVAELESAVDDPVQTVVVPVIVPASGLGFTVMICVALAVHPLLVTVYDIMVVPADTPVMVPDDEPAVAIPVLLLLHTPLPAASDRVVAVVGHKVKVPVMVPADGTALTVTTVVVLPPVENE